MQQQKRWYDEEPTVSEAISAWRTFPHSIQLTLANYINSLVDDQKQALRHSGSSDKVGRLPSKQLLGLYMTGLKRRWHDKEPAIRKAANSLVYVNREELLEFAERVLQVKSYLKDSAPTEAAALSDLDIAVMLSDLLQQFEQKSRD